MALLVRDGAYDKIGGLAVGPPEIEYPFEQNGDFTSMLLTQTYKQTPAAWIADQVAARYLQGVAQTTHATYGTLYLLGSSRPAVTPTGLYAFTRTWGRVPAQQTVPTSLFVTKPDIANLGTNYGNGNDITTAAGGRGTIPTYVYGGKTIFDGLVYSRTAATASAHGTPTGGTFTLTYGANTTAALNWNDNAATINTAVNGLASVSAAGLTFTANQGINTSGEITFTITGGTTSTRLTMNAGSLTPTSTNVAFTYVPNTNQQIIYIASRATLTAHGYAAGSNLLIASTSVNESNYSTLLPATYGWSVVDANTIAYMDVFLQAATTKAFGQSTGSYASGTTLVRAKRVTDFYLPGVTTGINTADDISVPTYQGSDSALIAAIFAGTTSINYEVGELTKWRDGPIYARTTTTLNATQL